MPFNFQRPNMPYVNTPKFNDDQFKQLQGNPPSPELMDGNFNYCIDSMGILGTAIDNVAAGILPGANVATNLNKLPTTDGNGNLSFIFVTGVNVQDNSLPATKLLAGSISSLQLGNGSVSTNKITQQAITQALMAADSVGLNQLIPDSVNNSVLASGAVIGSAVAPEDSSIAYQSIGTTDIGNQVITQDQMAANSIGLPQLIPGSVDITSLNLGLQGLFPPAGTVITFAGTTFPGVGTSWFECLGQLVSRTTYATLFANIGTTYGVGDGSTTFALPNMPGLTVVGISSTGSTNGLVTNATTPNIATGATFGEEQHTLTITEMPSHNHNLNIPFTLQFISQGGGVSSASQQISSVTTTSTGGSLPHNNMQPSIFMRYYIKMV